MHLIIYKLDIFSYLGGEVFEKKNPLRPFIALELDGGKEVYEEGVLIEGSVGGEIELLGWKSIEISAYMIFCGFLYFVNLHIFTCTYYTLKVNI